MSKPTVTLGMPTVGDINYLAVESLTSVVGSGLVQAVMLVPRLPVQIARTRIAKSFDTSHLLFIDDDMVFTPEDVARLLEHADKDIVCGLAYSRTQGEPRPIVLKYNDDQGQFYHDMAYKYGSDIDPAPVQIDGGTLAFTLIKREVFDRIGTEFKFLTDPLCGEDVDFFLRCREAGLETWLEPAARIGHISERVI